MYIKFFSILGRSKSGRQFEKSSFESFWCMGITSVVFSLEGKTPEKKEILNISDNWLEMSFLSNFIILVGILLHPTDFLESNEDVTFSISVLSLELTKKEILDLFLRKSEKCLCENEILTFVLLVIEEE